MAVFGIKNSVASKWLMQNCAVVTRHFLLRVTAAALFSGREVGRGLVRCRGAWNTDRQSEGPCVEQLPQEHSLPHHFLGHMSWSRYLQALPTMGTGRDQQGLKEPQGGTGLSTPWEKLGTACVVFLIREAPRHYSCLPQEASIHKVCFLFHLKTKLQCMIYCQGSLSLLPGLSAIPHSITRSGFSFCLLLLSSMLRTT